MPFSFFSFPRLILSSLLLASLNSSKPTGSRRVCSLLCLWAPRCCCDWCRHQLCGRPDLQEGLQARWWCWLWECIPFSSPVISRSRISVSLLLLCQAVLARWPSPCSCLYVSSYSSHPLEYLQERSSSLLSWGYLIAPHCLTVVLFRTNHTTNRFINSLTEECGRSERRCRPWPSAALQWGTSWCNSQRWRGPGCRKRRRCRRASRNPPWLCPCRKHQRSHPSTWWSRTPSSSSSRPPWPYHWPWPWRWGS